jgi:hypothetical protein
MVSSTRKTSPRLDTEKNQDQKIEQSSSKFHPRDGPSIIAVMQLVRVREKKP